MGIAAKVKTNGELEDVQWQQGKQLALNYVIRPFEKNWCTSIYLSQNI
jgi:hypothetical protein